MAESNVQEWYNNYADHQEKVGINYRNIMIQKWMVKFGVKKHHSVLEVGCGIGTQTELIANYLTKGKVLANDISDKSIEVAKSRLINKNNATFIVGDIINLNLNEEKFDFIILPDVIEHIPLEGHQKLFNKLSQVLKTNGKIIIHIPFPNYLDWVHKNRPELLQVIDQPVYTELLANNIKSSNLYISNLITYPIWIKNCDYQLITLEKHLESSDFSQVNPPNSLKTRIHNKLVKILNKLFDEKEFNPHN